jgi:7-carboxy-7-deazaguanine synthase
MIAKESTYNILLEDQNTLHLTLPVMEAFYTLQGEGAHQGKAAYFIRLGGCDVGCFWCDVKESWDASAHPQKTIKEIIEAIKLETSDQLSANNKPIIVITGGEPLVHNLDALTLGLRNEGFKTHIETSGSSPLSGSWDWICLSPKKFKKPLPAVFAAAHELKVIIYNKSDFKWAEENAAQVWRECKLFLQPEWSRATTITPSIINYIQANPKWQLSLQVHKYLDIR